MKKIISFFSSMLLSATIIAQQFTIGVMPDTQNMTFNSTDAKKISAMTQYFIDNELLFNVRMVVSVGDIVYGYSSSQNMRDQFNRAKPAYNLLENAGIPYMPCQGNHDHDLAMLNEFFPVSTIENINPYFGGSMNGGIENCYYLFSEAGMDFVMVIIQTHDQFITQDHGVPYDWASINWANSIFQQYSSRRGIFVTHDFFEPSGYKLINDVIKQNDNIDMAFCGHSCSRVGFDGQPGRERYWTETSNGGNTAHCLLSDYQCDGDGGATVRYYTFKPSENKVYAYTYNVHSKSFETDASSQFSFDYQMTSPTNPVISAISHDPVYPLSSETPTVTATIKDDISISTATIHWGTASGALNNSVSMTTSGSDIYTGQIPTNADGSTVYYSISGTDGDDNETTSSEYSYEICDDKSCLACPFNTSQTPYTGNVGAVPGKIEAENYNVGCHEIAYYDSENSNKGGAYRTDVVDIEACSDAGGGYNVGWTVNGEWLNYKVDVATTGTYEFDFRVASSSNGSVVHLEVNDVDISGAINLPATGGWQNWKTYTATDIALTAGVQNIKMVIDDGDFNINYFESRLTSNTTLPQIGTITADPSTPSASDAITISALITDDISVSSAVLLWGTTSGILVNQETMTANGDHYSTVLSAQPDGTTIYYKIEATDGDGNKASSSEKAFTVSDQTFFYSYNVTMNSSAPQGSITSNDLTAHLEFYESTDNDGVAQGNNFSNFNPNNHPEAFNNVATIWSNSNYPYVGKSNKARGEDFDELNSPSPTGVYDLQMHPPSNSHLTVAAFVVPTTGKYIVSNLGVRRVYNSGSVALKLFDKDATLLATVTATSNAWVTETASYDLDSLTEGDKIHFAVDHVDGYSFDATEINWTISLTKGSGIVTHLNALQTESSFEVHPNPAQTDLITLKINSGSGIKYDVIIKDIQGKTMLINESDAQQINLDIANLSAGMYLIEVHTFNQIMVKKLVVR